MDALFSAYQHLLCVFLGTGNPNEASCIWYRGFALKNRSRVVSHLENTHTRLLLTIYLYYEIAVGRIKSLFSC